VSPPKPNSTEHSFPADILEVPTTVKNVFVDAK
jgi:hypothetical protein